MPSLRKADGGMTVAFRGFIAVEVPPGSGLESIAKELRTSGASLKIADTDHLHVTLKFLGDTEEGLVPEIVETIRRAVAGTPPFAVRLRGAGAFPNLSRMNVVWVGLENAEPLARIAERLESSLQALGFRPEGRPWSAHVTIARVKGGRNLDRVRQILHAHADEEFGECRVDAVLLKKSVLTPDGPVYSTVQEIPL